MIKNSNLSTFGVSLAVIGLVNFSTIANASEVPELNSTANPTQVAQLSAVGEAKLMSANQRAKLKPEDITIWSTFVNMIKSFSLNDVFEKFQDYEGYMRKEYAKRMEEIKDDEFEAPQVIPGKVLEPGLPRENDVTLSDKIRKGIRNFLTSETIQFKITPDVSFINDAVNIGVGYKYLVQPAYDGNNYLRLDQYGVGLTLGGNILKIFDIVKNNSPYAVNVSATKHVDFEMVRQQPSFNEAIRAPFKMPQEFPFTVEEIKNNLPPGNFTSMRAEMNFAFGIGFNPIVWRYLQAQFTYTHLLLKGIFRINVYRLSQNIVRLKIYLVHDNSNLAQFTFGTNSNYQIFTGTLGKFSTNLVENLLQLENLIVYQPVKDELSNIFTQIYDIDLNNPDATNNLESVLTAVKKTTLYSSDMINILNIIDPDTGSAYGDMKKTFAISMDPLIQAAKNPASTGVQPKFVATSTYKADSSYWNLNFLIDRYQKTNRFADTYAEVDTAGKPEDPSLSRYLFSTWASQYKNVRVFGLQDKVNILRSASGIYQTDKNKNVIRFVDIGFAYDGQERVLDVDDQLKIRDYLKKILPEFVYKQIDWGDFGNDDNYEVQYASRVQFQYFMSEAGYFAAKLEMLKATGVDQDEVDGDPTKGIPPNPDAYNKIVKYIITRINNKLEELERRHIPVLAPFTQKQEIAEKLATAFFAYDGDAAVAAFHSLRRVDTFADFGPGILIALLPEKRLGELLFFELHGVAQGMRHPAYLRWGSNTNTKLYDEIRCQNAISRDDSFELRIRCDRDIPKM